ncbi:MAG: SGNH/GDSL hydrolase family protein [Jatrophihabitans sp.]|uniref:SGNH/GDSL hydrolase family protein n=1 Tax=Jatrophihabitans sp. TaxID=1932789 RepID=UPI00390DECBB
MSIAVAAAAVASAVVIPASPATADATPHYYVALGDSLSVGYMPGSGDTNQGYSDDLYQSLLAKDPSLQLVKLGCSGETTTTMINGGKCTSRYPLGTSQLAVAEQFLRAHPGQVTHLTLDIGANDVDGCAFGGSIDALCVAQGTTTIATNLDKILDGLTAADARLPLSAGMTYNDPFLASWLTGLQGQLVAAASVSLLLAINSVESLEYVAHGFKVADVAATFHTLDFVTQPTVAHYGSLPRNVADICQFTFMCSQLNIHPTVAGYQLIANTFAAKFGA